MIEVEKKALLLFSLLGLAVLWQIRFAERFNTKKARQLVYLLTLTIVVFIIGFRFIDKGGWGGQDSYTYIKTFLNIKDKIKTDKTTEPFFLAYLFLLRSITENERVFIVVTAAVTTGAFLHFARNYYSDRSFVITLSLLWPVFLYYSCNALRNGLAIALSQFAWPMLTRKEYKKAGILFLAALLFHYSAIVVIGFELFYLVGKWLQKKGNRIYFIIALSAVAAIFMVPLAEMYLRSSRYAFLEGRSSSSLIGMLPYYVIGVAALINHKKIADRRNDDVCLYATYFLCLIYPICIRFGLYRLPYFLIAPLCVTAKDVCMHYYTKISPPRLAFRIIVFLVFSAFMVLKIESIAEQSRILLYRLTMTA